MWLMPNTNPPKSANAERVIEPIFVSVKEAGRALAITPWSVYQLCDRGEIESRYFGKRRLVSVDSLRAYAAGLPKQREE